MILDRDSEIGTRCSSGPHICLATSKIVLRRPSLPVCSKLRKTSYFALSGIGKNIGRDYGIRSSRCDILACEISQEASIGLTTESPRAAKPVQLANTTEVCAAVLIGSRIRAGEQLTIDRSLYNSWDVLENIALHQNKTTSPNFKGVPVGVAVIPVIVHLIRVRSRS